MKLVIVSVVIVLLCLNVAAQRRFEFQAGYGMYSYDVVTNEIREQGNALPNLTHKGSYFLTTRYALSYRFLLGITVNHYRMERSYPYTPEKIRATGFAPDFAWYYNTEGLIRTYMSGATGVTWIYHVGEYPKSHSQRGEFRGWQKDIFFHYSPIGVQVGRSFGLFTELGIGNKGLLNFGLFYKPQVQVVHR